MRQGSGINWHRSVQRQIRRSTRAAAAGRWHKALRINEQAVAAVQQAREDERFLPGDERMLPSLYYDRARICEALGDLSAAKRAAKRAWGLYLDLDPTHGDPSMIAAVLAPLQVPAVVTDYRNVRAAAQQHQRNEQQAEEAIAHVADAYIRLVRLDAQLEGGLLDTIAQSLPDENDGEPEAYVKRIRELALPEGEREAYAERIRKQGAYAVDIYRELIRVGQHYGPADLARVQAECDTALAAAKSP